MIVAKGCGFLTVRDVQVNVHSVPFTAIDDFTLVFPASHEPIMLDDAGDDLPLGEVDILRIQPDQVQGFITYTRQ